MNDGLIAMLVATGLAMMAGATIIGFLAARAGFPLPEQSRRMGCVDGLRGYLALSVLVYHYALWVGVVHLGLEWRRPDSDLIDSLGPGSVNLFFMVTGLVFYPRILDGLMRTRWPAVYISRIFRILPLVAVSILLIGLTILVRLDFRPIASSADTMVAAVQWLVAWAQPPLFGYPNSAALNAAVFWSLGYEWLFYLLVLPAAAAAMDLVKRLQLPTVTVPLVLIAAGVLLPRLISTPNLVTYLPMFGCGMLAFEVARGRVAAFLRTSPCSFLLGVLFVGGLFAGHSHGAIRLLCHALFFTGVASGNDLFGLLRLRGALVLGEASFAIYLLHGYVLNILFVDVVPAPGGSLLGLLGILPLAGICVTLLALASFICIEKPMIAVGKRLARRTAGERDRLDEPMLQVAP